MVCIVASLIVTLARKRGEFDKSFTKLYVCAQVSEFYFYLTFSATLVAYYAENAVVYS